MKRVLDSRALKRSEQLRQLFSYVCEAELQGNGPSLSEYVLGVNVLGRPAGYSPAEDSCVRTRAYELRQRLRVYYEDEAPDDPIRIIIEKGGYCPRFERASEPAAARTLAPAAAAPALSPELRALWGPFLEGSAPLLIAFDVRLFFYAPAAGLVIRDYQVNVPSEVVGSTRLEAFRRQVGETELRETRDYADFGTVHAAFLLGRLLGNRPDIGLKHSSSLDWQDIWNSHLIFIGKPNLNPTVSSLLEGKDFWTDEAGVHNLRPRAGEPAQYLSATTHGSGEKYAVITRLRGPQPGRFLLLLSSAAAELMWALAESVTNPGHVAEIMSHLQTPSGAYPDQFQVVIRAVFQSNVPVEIGYVTHRVVSKP